MVKRLEELLKPYLEKEGLRLYKIVLSSGGRRKKIVIYADGIDSHINVDQLTALNRFAGDVMDAEDLVNGSYLLEVSSPGTALLTEERDFKFFTGSFCRIVVEEGPLYGTIRSYADDVLTLDAKDGTEIRLQRDMIIKAKVDIDF